jgi:hypothetical protein
MDEAAGDRELARLRANETWMDEHTKSQLDATGLGPDWRCLEVAAGAGSIARWLGERVGPSGTVSAVDINTRFLTDLPANVTVVEHDITTGPPEPAAFDLVHSRSLLELAGEAFVVEPRHPPARRDLEVAGSPTPASVRVPATSAACASCRTSRARVAPSLCGLGSDVRAGGVAHALSRSPAWQVF